MLGGGWYAWKGGGVMGRGMVFLIKGKATGDGRWATIDGGQVGGSIWVGYNEKEGQEHKIHVLADCMSIAFSYTLIT